MDGRRIKVSIPQVGNPIVEAEGYNGQGCEDATRPIEQALAGSGETSREYKDEWSQGVDTAHEAEVRSW